VRGVGITCPRDAPQGSGGCALLQPRGRGAVMFGLLSDMRAPRTIFVAPCPRRPRTRSGQGAPDCARPTQDSAVSPRLSPSPRPPAGSAHAGSSLAAAEWALGIGPRPRVGVHPRSARRPGA